MTEAFDCAEGLLPFRLYTHIYWFFRHHYDGRPYHNFQHIEEMLALYAEVSALGLWEQPVEVAFAILFHDIVYEPGAKDNESKSAEMAKEWIPKFYPHIDVDINAVASAIGLTANHGLVRPEVLTSDAQLFLDCDMAILAAEPERFLEYDKAIAEEYSEVPRDLYLAGRKRFFEHLLSREQIFMSEHFRSKFEEKARQNIAFALTRESPRVSQH